jgi:hypothetical protein
VCDRCRWNQHPEHHHGAARDAFDVNSHVTFPFRSVPIGCVLSLRRPTLVNVRWKSRTGFPSLAHRNGARLFHGGALLGRVFNLTGHIAPVEVAVVTCDSRDRAH